MQHNKRPTRERIQELRWYMKNPGIDLSIREVANTMEELFAEIDALEEEKKKARCDLSNYCDYCARMLEPR